MIVFIETKFTLEIIPCHYITSDFVGITTELYAISLKDQRSKKELTHRLVHQDEILNHVEEMLPTHYNQIKNQIKSEFNLI